MISDNTPTSDEFRPVVLRVLADGKARPLREIYRAVADQMKLAPKVLEERVSSGEHRYSHRIRGRVLRWLLGDYWSARSGLITKLLRMGG